MLPTWVWPHGLQPVYVLVETRADVVPQWIEHHIQTLATSELRCRDEISVSCNQDDSLYQSLVRQGRDVDADLDVHALLSRVVCDITVRELIDGNLALQKSSSRLSSEEPLTTVMKFTQSQCDLAQAHQLMMQLNAKSRSIRFAEVDGAAIHRVVRLLLQRLAVIHEDSIELLV